MWLPSLHGSWRMFPCHGQVSTPRARGGHTRKVAVLAWKLKLTLSGGRWGFQGKVGPWCMFPYLDQCRAPHGRARARAPPCSRGVHNREVAMVAWKLQRTVRGDRLHFQVSMGPCENVSHHELHRTPRARMLARRRRIALLCALRCFAFATRGPPRRCHGTDRPSVMASRVSRHFGSSRLFGSSSTAPGNHARSCPSATPAAKVSRR